MLYPCEVLSTVPGHQNRRVHFIIFINLSPPPITAIIVGGPRGEGCSRGSSLREGSGFHWQSRTQDRGEMGEGSVGAGGGVLCQKWNLEPHKKFSGRRCWAEFYVFNDTSEI